MEEFVKFGTAPSLSGKTDTPLTPLPLATYPPIALYVYPAVRFNGGLLALAGRNPLILGNLSGR